MRVRSYPLAAALAILGGFSSAALIVIWLLGDLSTAAEIEGPGYVPPAPPIPESVILAGGIIGGVVLLAVAAAIRAFPRAYLPLGAAALAGVLAGVSYRTWFADVIGANIGAGLVVLIVLPMVVLLLLSAGLMAYLLRQKQKAYPPIRRGS